MSRRQRAAGDLDLATTRGIVQALGGVQVVMERTGRTHRSAISNWHRLGFPRAVEGDLISLAHERGVRGVTVAVLRAASDRAVVKKRRLGRKAAPARRSGRTCRVIAT